MKKMISALPEANRHEVSMDAMRFWVQSKQPRLFRNIPNHDHAILGRRN